MSLIHCINVIPGRRIRARCAGDLVGQSTRRHPNIRQMAAAAAANALAAGGGAPGAPMSLFSHALKLLMARPHSRAELADKLTRVCRRRRTSKLAGVAGEYAEVDCGAAVAAVLTTVTDLGVLDDAAYAKWHVQNRVEYRPRSRLQLMAELAAKRVTSADVKAALAAGGGTPTPFAIGLPVPSTDDSEDRPFDEVAACVAVAARRPRADDKQLLTFLARKGFPLHVIRAALRQLRGAGGEGDADAPLR